MIIKITTGPPNAPKIAVLDDPPPPLSLVVPIRQKDHGIKFQHAYAGNYKQ